VADDRHRADRGQRRLAAHGARPQEPRLADPLDVAVGHDVHRAGDAGLQALTRADSLRAMAAQLWLLRHGEAEPHDARPDDERRLTERGEGQSRAAGRALAALGITFQAVYTSPKERAAETARLACEALGCTPIEHQALADGLDVREALELLRSCGEDGRVLVVGHNPDFAQVVHDLTGARADLKKGGVAGIRSAGTEHDLLVLLRPRELDRIAGTP
jgi:phosphohistidine phosphatase